MPLWQSCDNLVAILWRSTMDSLIDVLHPCLVMYFILVAIYNSITSRLPPHISTRGAWALAQVLVIMSRGYLEYLKGTRGSPPHLVFKKSGYEVYQAVAMSSEMRDALLLGDVEIHEAYNIRAKIVLSCKPFKPHELKKHVFCVIDIRSDGLCPKVSDIDQPPHNWKQSLQFEPTTDTIFIATRPSFQRMQIITFGQKAEIPKTWVKDPKYDKYTESSGYMSFCVTHLPQEKPILFFSNHNKFQSDRHRMYTNSLRNKMLEKWLALAMVKCAMNKAQEVNPELNPSDMFTLLCQKTCCFFNDPSLIDLSLISLKH